MRGVKYVGPIMDHSGYGQAARNYVLALYRKGVPLTVKAVSFERDPPPIGVGGEKEILDSLVDKNVPYDVVITHLTPDLLPQYTETGKYNISYFAWETTLLHPQWVQCLKGVNEIWVPCDWNIQAVRNSGIVDIPVYKIPHGIDVDMFNHPENNKFSISGLSEDTFKFYSIFQWIYRKNPDGLIRAYFNAFDASDKVALVLKTYRTGNILKDKEFISERVNYIKKDMGIGGYPRVVLVADRLSKSQMIGLHHYGDCCVSLHRAEGWGLTPFEAGLSGKPVIATGYSGNLEFMNRDNSYLVDNQETYVSEMIGFNMWYLSSGAWSEPNLIHATKCMRDVFYNREEALRRGEKLRKDIIENYSFSSVADLIIDRINSI